MYDENGHEIKDTQVISNGHVVVSNLFKMYSEVSTNTENEQENEAEVGNNHKQMCVNLLMVLLFPFESVSSISLQGMKCSRRLCPPIAERLLPYRTDAGKHLQ